MALVYPSEKFDEPSRVEEAHVEHAWWNSMETGLKPIVKLMIDSRVLDDGSIEEYVNRDIGFSYAEGINLINTSLS